MIKRVEGAVDQSRLSIRPLHDEGLCVYYDDVPLWRTVVLLPDLDIFLCEPWIYAPAWEDTPEPYALFCIDNCGDIYTYGSWESEAEAREWLKNPVALY